MGFLSKFEGKMEDTFEDAADKVIKTPISPVQIMKKAEKQMRREKMVGAGKQFAPTLYTVLVNPDDDERLFGYYPTLAGETETFLQAKASEQGLAMDGQPLVRFVVDDALRHGKFEVIAELVAAPIISQLRAEEMQRYGLSPAGRRQAAPGQAAQRYATNGGRGAYAAPAGQQQRPQPARQQAPQQMPSQARPPQAAVPQVQQEAYPLQSPQTFYGQDAYAQPVEQDAQYDQSPYGREGAGEPLPYVPEEELDYSIDYGEYTFDSLDYNEHQGLSSDAGGHGAHHAAPAAPRPAAAAAAQPFDDQTALFDDHAAGAVQPQQAQQAPQRTACLVDMATNRSYELRGIRMTIGRESANDITIPDISVSRRHAELALDLSGDWVLSDLGSTNGTMVNNRTVAVQPLAVGDRITVGTTVLLYTLA